MTRGELKEGEPHPMAQDALTYVKTWIHKGGMKEVAMLRESFASCAIEGNRVGEICGETFDRIMTGQPVSDRYLLGLAWFLRNMEEQKG